VLQPGSPHAFLKSTLTFAPSRSTCELEAQLICDEKLLATFLDAHSARFRTSGEALADDYGICT
jgi:hypothetical protein